MKKTTISSKRMLLQISGIIGGLLLIILMAVYVYKQSSYTIYLDGTINTISEQKIITFSPFDKDTPSELALPIQYNFETGERVICELKVHRLFFGNKYIKLIDINELTDNN